MRKNTKGRKVQEIKNPNGSVKVINHNWTYRIAANRSHPTYSGKHFKK